MWSCHFVGLGFVGSHFNTCHTNWSQVCCLRARAVRRLGTFGCAPKVPSVVSHRKLSFSMLRRWRSAAASIGDGPVDASGNCRSGDSPCRGAGNVFQQRIARSFSQKWSINVNSVGNHLESILNQSWIHTELKSGRHKIVLSPAARVVRLLWCPWLCTTTGALWPSWQARESARWAIFESSPIRQFQIRKSKQKKSAIYL